MTLKIMTRAAAILTVVALTACGGPRYQATPQTSFDAQSADALVVIGMQGIGPHFANALGMEAAYPAFSLTWVRTEKGADGKWATFVTVPRLAGVGNIRDVNHTAYSVPPGRYFLHRLTVVQEAGNLITTRRITLKHDPALGFEVKAGEIAYIGDFMVDALAIPPRIEHYGHDEGKAAATIKLYTKIRGEVRYKPLVPLRVTEEPVLYE